MLNCYLSTFTLQKGDSAVDVAAKEGKLEVVEFLLGKGASTYTPCEANSVSIKELLVDYKDINN